MAGVNYFFRPASLIVAGQSLVISAQLAMKDAIRMARDATHSVS
jgi:hypothetical protein